ncbi:MAG: hypothetical protein HPY52_11135 [Firmicutes bacterium]|nr:hypothetical protein [Bacillota bacterium]
MRYKEMSLELRRDGGNRPRNRQEILNALDEAKAWVLKCLDGYDSASVVVYIKAPLEAKEEGF